jgi:hypothetical protein
MGRVRYNFSNNGKIETIHKVIVKKIRMGDVEDPDLFVADPIYKWQQTDAGRFIMENAEQAPEWHRTIDTNYYGYVYLITAELEEKKLSEFYLRWGNTCETN